LGEAQSKCEHIAGVPLKPETAEELQRVYLFKGASATTAIEGNTLTEEEARAYVEKKLELPPSKKYLGQEIENIVNAFNSIIDHVKIGKAGRIKVEDLNRCNYLTLKGLNLPEDVIPGKTRKYSVKVGSYRGAPSKDCQYLLQRTCDWINGKGFTLGEGHEIASGILKAIISHLYIAWIHPYGDGNGRTARLIEFQILLDAGVPSPAAHLPSNHYNLTRTEYYRQLAQTSRTADIVPFIKYALQGFVDGLVSQLETIRNQTLDVSWENYIHEYFKNNSGPAQERRRLLTLDLSKQTEPVLLLQLKHLSPRLAELYAIKNQKVIYNDVKELISAGLIVQESKEKGVESNKKIISAFLPFSKGSKTQGTEKKQQQQ
jgi:Fic family protein